MKNTNYILAIFDTKLDCYNVDEVFIQAIIELLRTETFRNKSIQISKNTLLIRVFDVDFNSYPYPKNQIDDSISELIQKEIFSYDDVKNLNIYCLPVNLKDIDSEVLNFEREIDYLNELVVKSI